MPNNNSNMNICVSVSVYVYQQTNKKKVFLRFTWNLEY